MKQSAGTKMRCREAQTATHPDKPSPGGLLAARLADDCRTGRWRRVNVDGASISSSASRSWYVRGLFPMGEIEDAHPEPTEEMRKARVRLCEAIASRVFTQDRFCGSVTAVGCGAVERHLAPRPDGDDELVRLTTWPGEDMTGAEIIAVERQPLGWSGAIRIPVEGPVVRIRWPKRVGQTGLAIFHPEEGLCWSSEILPFVRTIALSIEGAGTRRRVVVEGKTRETYEVTERVPVREAPIIIGDSPDPLSVSARYSKAKTLQERRQISVRLGVRWFDDPATAAAEIRALLQSAKEFVWIVDPYCAVRESCEICSGGAISRCSDRGYHVGGIPPRQA